MKPDTIVFSTSEEFSQFWNINSKIWSSFGVKPVCLFFGDLKNTDVTEDYGEVINMPINQNLPLLIQITWSKFWWACQQKNKTSIIGDIDLIPLQSKYFFNSLSSVPESNYVHLDCDAITQVSQHASWIGATKENINLQTAHPTNLPGHYHCATGDTYKIALNQHESFEEEVSKIVNSGIYYNNRAERVSDSIKQDGLWCAEEFFSTKSIRENIHKGNIEFTGFSLVNGISPTNASHFLDTGIKSACPHCKGADGETIDRTMYDNEIKDFIYHENKLLSGGYVDLHCIRPFSNPANQKIIELSGVI